MEQQIGGVQRHELLATALREDDTTVATISIHTNIRSRARLRTIIIKHYRVWRALQGHQQGWVLQPRPQYLSHLGPFWGSHMCLQWEEHNSRQRHQ